MFKKVLLTKEEKKVIKKITRVQIRNLINLINHDSVIDLKLFAFQEEIPENLLIEKMEDSLNLYNDILENPRELFNLDEENLSIAKHIMWNFINHSKYDLGRTRVWKKMLIMEKFPICLQ